MSTVTSWLDLVPQVSEGSLAAVLVAVAVWWLVPSPASARMSRSQQGVGRWEAVVRSSVPGAPSARSRSWAAIAVACLWFVLAPGSSAWRVAGAAVLGPVTWWASGRFVTAAHRRVERRRRADLPEALDLLAGALDAGLPTRAAVRWVADHSSGPCADDLRTVVARVAAGVPDARAWHHLARVPVWSEAADDLSRAVDSGEGVVELLRSHATRLREELAEEVDRRARQVGVQAIGPLVCCQLPAFILVGVVPIIAGTLMRHL